MRVNSTNRTIETQEVRVTPNMMSPDEIVFWKQCYVEGIQLFKLPSSLRPPLANDNCEYCELPADYAATFANASIEELRGSIKRFAEDGSYIDKVEISRIHDE